jgi:hypothetical protein
MVGRGANGCQRTAPRKMSTTCTRPIANDRLLTAAAPAWSAPRPKRRPRPGHGGAPGSADARRTGSRPAGETARYADALAWTWRGAGRVRIRSPEPRDRPDGGPGRQRVPDGRDGHAWAIHTSGLARNLRLGDVSVAARLAQPEMDRQARDRLSDNHAITTRIPCRASAGAASRVAGQHLRSFPAEPAQQAIRPQRHPERVLSLSQVLALRQHAEPRPAPTRSPPAPAVRRSSRAPRLAAPVSAP